MFWVIGTHLKPDVSINVLYLDGYHFCKPILALAYMLKNSKGSGSIWCELSVLGDKRKSMSTRPIQLTAFKNGHMENKIFELEFKTLYAISHKIGGVLDLDSTLMSILEILSKKLSMKRGHDLFERQGEGDCSELLPPTVRTPSRRKEESTSPAKGLPVLSLKPPNPFAVPDIGKEPLFFESHPGPQPDQKQPGFYRRGHPVEQSARWCAKRRPAFRP